MSTRRLLTIVLCAFCAAVGLRILSREFLKLRAITEHSVAPAAKIPAAVRSLRPNYPYSVIPGGAYSPAELYSANKKDTVVREHYADFDLKAARLVTLTEDRYQYVSYRLKNQVYWTRNKLRIPKGEVLLSDGCNFARTRCGNRLSSKAKPNTSQLQPAERLLSLPAFRPQLLAEGDVTLAPPPDLDLPRGFPTLPFDLARLAPTVPVGTPLPQPVAQGWSPIGIYPAAIPTLTGFLPGPNSTPIITGGVPPVVADVPEPASLYLFGLAFCLSLWFLMRMMRTGASPETGSGESDD
jgi:hypothetical protein